MLLFQNAKRLGFLAVIACGPFVAACSLPFEQLAVPAPITGTIGRDGGSGGGSKTGAPLSGAGSAATREHRNFAGTGDFTGKATKVSDGAATAPAGAGGAASPASVEPGSQVTKDGITLNLVGASVTEVAKTVLGDVLGVNYTVSDQVKATITLRTARPVEKASLLSIFESVLREEGATIVVEGDLYRIIPSTAAAASGAPLRSHKAGRAFAGIATELIPMRFVAAAEMERILKSAAPQANILRVDTARNLLMVSGTRAELNAMSELINTFDVDWMRGMSFGIYPVETPDPEAIAQELDTIFANDTKDSPTKGLVRFVPNRRLKSILVITSRPEYLKKAETWLSRIDLASRATEKQVNVYNVQHRPAVELAQLLQKVYQSRAGSTNGAAQGSARTTGQSAFPDSNGGTSAGGAAGSTLASAAASGLGGGGGVGTSGGSTVGVSAPNPSDGGADPSKAGPAGDPQAAGDTLSPANKGSSSAPPPDDRSNGISVVADEIKNALIITATPVEYRRIKQVLASVDVEANQILIEATIAEVTLNDNLKFGVRWFLGHGKNFGEQNSAISPDPLAALPVALPGAAAGFQYFLNMKNLQVVLSALSAVTNVDVVSSPSVMVMENKRAVLQVGDEVPIVTQQANNIATSNATIVNAVSYRSTGIILGITPRLSDDGRVFLEIEQEVSNVSSTASSTGSPTISQRRVKTTVTVNDGETIVLAGLMKDDATRNRDQVPLLGDVPLFGNAFKNKDDTIKRTELLISITPQVIRNRQQIDDVTAEYRDNLNFSTRPQRRGPPDHREQFDRIVR